MSFEHWPILPDHLKQRVVGNLNFRERIDLRESSKANRDLVDSCLIDLKSIKILSDEPSIISVILTFGDTKLKKTSKDAIEAAEDFLRLTKNTDSKFFLTKFQFHNDCKTNRIFLRTIRDALAARDEEFSIKTPNLEWKSGIKSSEFLPGIIVKMDIMSLELSGEMPEAVLEQLVKTKQWLSARQLEFRLGPKGDYAINTPIENFFHAEQLILVTNTISDMDILKLVCNMEQSSRRICSFISIFAGSVANHPDLLELFENPPRGEGITLPHYSVHRIPLRENNSSLIFVHSRDDRAKIIHAVVCGNEELAGRPC